MKPLRPAPLPSITSWQMRWECDAYNDVSAVEHVTSWQMRWECDAYHDVSAVAVVAAGADVVAEAAV